MKKKPPLPLGWTYSSSVGLLSLMLLAGCAKPPSMKEAKPPTNGQLSEFARHTGITFPTTAAPLLFWEERGMDDALFLKLTLPAEAYPAFVSSPPFAGEKMSGPRDHPDVALYYFKDWMPQSPNNFQFCELSLPNARYMKCIFDFDDPKTITLYLMWFET